MTKDMTTRRYTPAQRLRQQLFSLWADSARALANGDDIDVPEVRRETDGLINEFAKQRNTKTDHGDHAVRIIKHLRNALDAVEYVQRAPGSTLNIDRQVTDEIIDDVRIIGRLVVRMEEARRG